jgi:hypothetical protein
METFGQRHEHVGVLVNSQPHVLVTPYFGDSPDAETAVERAG